MLLGAMPRADLLIDLVRATRPVANDDVRRVVEALIAEEEAKHHHGVASRLREALRTNSRNGIASPGHVDDLPSGLQLRRPDLRLDDLVLPDLVTDAFGELVHEQRRIELLRSQGLEPRHRVLLLGEPGTGKTSVAEALADALMLPFVVVRYEAVIGSFLGETGSRLASLFEWARTRRCLLFFDEFDAIAKERGDEHETGEVKRVVSSLLMLIDELPSHVVVVSASNHPELLDRAVERRFELVLTLPTPSAAARLVWWERYLRHLSVQVRISPKTLASRTPVRNFAELDNLGLDIRRQLVLRPDANPSTVISERVTRWRDRRSRSA